MHLLLRQQAAIDVVGDADPAGLGEGLGVFLREQRAPHAGRAAAAERPVAVEPGRHLLEHGIDEYRLEVLRGGARLGVVGDGHRLLDCGGGKQVERLEAGGGEGEVGCHHITSMSAWMAPAALIACRIAIRSRGPMPSALSPSTSCCSDTPSLTKASFLPSSCTPIRVRGTTCVVPPREKALGWLTCGVSEIVTVRLPCATATIDTRTSRPITIMPERSSITILAARSGSICNCSISVRSDTTLPAYCFGTFTDTVDWSSGSAVLTPMK